MTEPSSSESESSPTGVRCFIRYCFYLHLGTARKNGQKWYDQNSRSHPVFNVEGKARWVLVCQDLESDWVQIYQLTSGGKTQAGRVKPRHLLLGRIIPSEGNSLPAKQSWVQCVPERYPTRLIKDAEVFYDKTPIELDRNVAKSFLSAIIAESAKNWFE